MEPTVPVCPDTEAFNAFLQTRDEPAWLRENRRRAWESYRAMSWPDRGDEEWSRTDIRQFKPRQFSIPPAAVDGPPGFTDMPSATLADGVDLGGQVIIANGRPVATRLADKWQACGVVFGELSEATRGGRDRLRPYLERRVVDPGYDKFAALATACWSTGNVLLVPRGVAVTEPLHAFSGLADGQTDLSRSVVILEEGAEATLLCETTGVDESGGGLHCGTLELILQPAARLRIVHLQNWGRSTWHFAHHKAVLARDASLQWTVAALGSRLAKVNQHVALLESGADCQVNGVIFTEGRQHIAYHTLQHHMAPRGRSDFLYKSALQDRSRAVWRGMIKVDPDAQQSDGYQRNDTLMLSDSARADSIPGLEIQADNVRCTHGSTTGRVDDEQVFYAECRGFTRKEATRAIVAGFFQQIFDRITIGSVRDALGLAIAKRVRAYE